MHGKVCSEAGKNCAIHFGHTPNVRRFIFVFYFRLFTEFPELKSVPVDTIAGNHFNIFEIGCGVGNTIFPILKYNVDEHLRVFGCDFSSRAIDILREHEEFDAKRCQVFVLDATNETWTDATPFDENSMDIIVLIFVLSAIKPEK